MDETQTTKEMQGRAPEITITSGTEMVMIGSQIWRKGPDNLWYLLDDKTYSTVGEMTGGS